MYQRVYVPGTRIKQLLVRFERTTLQHSREPTKTKPTILNSDDHETPTQLQQEQVPHFSSSLVFSICILGEIAGDLRDRLNCFPIFRYLLRFIHYSYIQGPRKK